MTVARFQRIAQQHQQHHLSPPKIKNNNMIDSVRASRHHSRRHVRLVTKTLLMIMMMLTKTATSAFVIPSYSVSTTRTNRLPLDNDETTTTKTTATAPFSPRGSLSTTTTSLHMFMGSDGGVLGVGTPEVVRPSWRETIGSCLWSEEKRETGRTHFVCASCCFSFLFDLLLLHFDAATTCSLNFVSL